MAKSTGIARELFAKKKVAPSGASTTKHQQTQPERSQEERKNCPVSPEISGGAGIPKLDLGNEFMLAIEAARLEYSGKDQKNGEGVEIISDGESCCDDTPERSDFMESPDSSSEDKPLDFSTSIARSHSDMPLAEKSPALKPEDRDKKESDGPSETSARVLKIYSTRLATIELCVRKTQSERPSAEVTQSLPQRSSHDLEWVCEEAESNRSDKDLEEVPDNLVKRLSCFESICPSEQVESEDEESLATLPISLVRLFSTENPECVTQASQVQPSLD